MHVVHMKQHGYEYPEADHFHLTKQLDIHRLLQEQIAAQTITKQDAPATMMGSAVGMVESFFDYISVSIKS
jgi:hypothetical protein